MSEASENPGKGQEGELENDSVDSVQLGVDDAHASKAELAEEQDDLGANLKLPASASSNPSLPLSNPLASNNENDNNKKDKVENKKYTYKGLEGVQRNTRLVMLDGEPPMGLIIDYPLQRGDPPAFFLI